MSRTSRRIEQELHTHDVAPLWAAGSRLLFPPSKKLGPSSPHGSSPSRSFRRFPLPSSAGEAAAEKESQGEDSAADGDDDGELAD